MVEAEDGFTKEVNVASPDSLCEALIRGMESVGNGCIASEQSAGWLSLPDGQVQVQVIVKVCAFDEQLLSESPETCGLLLEDRLIRQAEQEAAEMEDMAESLLACLQRISELEEEVGDLRNQLGFADTIVSGHKATIDHLKSLLK